MGTTPPRQAHERELDGELGAASAAVWAHQAAIDLSATLPAGPLAELRNAVSALVSDAMLRGVAPASVRVAVSGNAVEVSVTDGRGIALRSLHHAAAAAALKESRRRGVAWRICLAHERPGSTVTVVIPVRRPRRLMTPRLRRLRGGGR